MTRSYLVVLPLTLAACSSSHPVLAPFDGAFPADAGSAGDAAAPPDATPTFDATTSPEPRDAGIGTVRDAGGPFDGGGDASRAGDCEAEEMPPEAGSPPWYRRYFWDGTRCLSRFVAALDADAGHGTEVECNSSNLSCIPSAYVEVGWGYSYGDLSALASILGTCARPDDLDEAAREAEAYLADFTGFLGHDPHRPGVPRVVTRAVVDALQRRVLAGVDGESPVVLCENLFALVANAVDPLDRCSEPTGGTVRCDADGSALFCRGANDVVGVADCSRFAAAGTEAVCEVGGVASVSCETELGRISWDGTSFSCVGTHIVASYGDRPAVVAADCAEQFDGGRCGTYAVLGEFPVARCTL